MVGKLVEQVVLWVATPLIILACTILIVGMPLVMIHREVTDKGSFQAWATLCLFVTLGAAWIWVLVMYARQNFRHYRR